MTSGNAKVAVGTPRAREAQSYFSRFYFICFPAASKAALAIPAAVPDHRRAILPRWVRA